MFRRRKQKTCPHLFLFGCPYCSTDTEPESDAPHPVALFDDVPPMPLPVTPLNGATLANDEVTALGVTSGNENQPLTENAVKDITKIPLPFMAGVTNGSATLAPEVLPSAPVEIPLDPLPVAVVEAPPTDPLTLTETMAAPNLATPEAVRVEVAQSPSIVESNGISEKSTAIEVSVNDTPNSLPFSLTPSVVSAETIFAEVMAETVALSRDNLRTDDNLALTPAERPALPRVSPMRSVSSNMTSETAFPTLAAAPLPAVARKRKSRFSLSRLRTLVSDSLAIDMGSTSTIIAVHGRGIVVDEPSVVALHKLTGEPVAFGYEAHQMQGREAREITVVSPLVNGVVADWEVTQAMLDHFVRAAHSGFSHFSRRAIMSIVSGITQVEQRALLQAVERARINRTFMVEEGLAAALGGGVPPDDDRGSAVVDIGGSTTNVAAVAQGKIVHAHAERIGGNDINSAIVEHMRRHHGLGIGQQSAENLKIELGCATVPDDLGRTKLVKGRDIQTGSPGASEVTAGEIYAVAHPILHQIAKTVNQALTELPSEVAADIYDRGLILTGGGALLTGFVDYLNTETRLPVRLADEPRFAIVRGLAQMFEDPSLLQRIVRQEELELLEAEAQAFES